MALGMDVPEEQGWCRSGLQARGDALRMSMFWTIGHGNTMALPLSL